MPFRERVKRVFGRSGSQSDDIALKQSKSGKGSSNVYQPGDVMPKPKYRQPVDKQHKERLDAFTFVDNFRRKSAQSLYSPMGSRVPSRNNSLTHTPKFTRGQSHVGMVVENTSDDADVINVGGSRQHSKDGLLMETFHSDEALATHQELADSQLGQLQQLILAKGSAPDHKPFSEEDLNMALAKTASRNVADQDDAD